MKAEFYSYEKYISELCPEAPMWVVEQLALEFEAKDSRIAKGVELATWLNERPQIFLGAIGRDLVEGVLKR